MVGVIDVFADSSRGSDPALARDMLTSSPKGSPKQQRARSAVRLIDIKREASVDVASTSNAQLIAPVVAVSELSIFSTHLYAYKHFFEVVSDIVIYWWVKIVLFSISFGKMETS
jgi:hypothetical protein